MRKKRFLGLFTAVTLAVSTIGMTVSAKNVDDFSDVNSGCWYYDVVKDVAEKELMTGMNDSYFGATELLARSHVACVLYRMDGEPQTEYQPLYPDVADGQFYSEAVTWANQTNVITGYSNGEFGPADNITREQLVTIMYRYAQLKGKENVSEKVSLDSYADGSGVSPFATEAMQWAVATGVIKGEGNSGLLNPQGSVSRAVCAAIISRFSEDNAQHEHNWTTHYTDVYHDAVYEDRPVYKWVGYYECKKCHFQTEDGDAIGDHCLDCASRYTTKKKQVQTGTERVKVKDAWTEQVADGQVCSSCGARQ